MTEMLRDIEPCPAAEEWIKVEQALLGAVLVHPASLAVVSGVIGPDSLFEPLHGKLFKLIERLVSEGRDPSPMMLAPFLREEPPINGFTVVQYLGRLMSAACSIQPQTVKGYAESIREAHCRRQFHNLGRNIANNAFDALAGITESAQYALSQLDDILAASRASRLQAVSIGQAAQGLLDRLDDDNAPPPVASGLADFDRMTGGFRRGEFTVLAGRPSMGKSAVACEVMRNTANAGHGALMFSLEMGLDEVSARCLSSTVWNSQTPIPYVDILRGRAVEKWRLRDAQERLAALPYRIDPQPGLTVSEIGVRARRYAEELEREGKRLDFILVDHLGKAKASSRYSGNLVAETGEISGALAELAKQLDCAVVAACQLNRAVEGRENKRPELSDLRNSGDIEQDAHVVTFVYRPAYYLERAKHDDAEAEAERVEALAVVKNDLELIIAKNRNGPTGTVECYVDVASNAVRNLVRAS